MGFNRVIYMGRLTRDPETRVTQGGTASITRFTVAVDRDYKAAGEDRPKTDFISCKAWNKTGEFVQKYFKKGSMILVEGSTETGSYLDNETGKTVYTSEAVISKVSFTGEKREATGSSPVDSDGFMSIPDGIDEELPFN